MRIFSQFVFGVIFLILSACTPFSFEEGVEQPPTATLPIATAVSTPTPTIQNSTTPSPPQTPSPTPDPSPTATPTLSQEDSVTGSYSHSYFEPVGYSHVLTKDCVLMVIQETVSTVDLELSCQEEWFGETQGGHLVQTLPLNGKVATYQTAQFDQECVIEFMFEGGRVHITQSGSWKDCGFGGGVDVSGYYESIELDPLLSCQPSNCEATPFAMPVPIVRNSTSSPDGEWMAFVETGYFDAIEQEMRLRVRHEQSGTEWVADRYILIQPSTVPVPKHWSEDGQYFYFSHTHAVDGCSRVITDMNRLDLQTGEVTKIASHAYWYDFSPNGQKLPYYVEGTGLIVHDLIDSTEEVIPIDLVTKPDYFSLTNLTWSSDSQSFVMIVHINYCDGGDLRDGIVYINIVTQEQKMIVLEGYSIHHIEGWSEENSVLLSLHGQFSKGWLNLETGELVGADS